MNDGLYMVVEKQNEIIRMQSEVINNLFRVVMQHIGAEEADRLPCVRTINEAAKLRQQIEE